MKTSELFRICGSVIASAAILVACGSGDGTNGPGNQPNFSVTDGFTLMEPTGNNACSIELIALEGNAVYCSTSNLGSKIKITAPNNQSANNAISFDQSQVIAQTLGSGANATCRVEFFVSGLIAETLYRVSVDGFTAGDNSVQPTTADFWTGQDVSGDHCTSNFTVTGPGNWKSTTSLNGDFDFDDYSAVGDILVQQGMNVLLAAFGIGAHPGHNQRIDFSRNLSDFQFLDQHIAVYKVAVGGGAVQVLNRITTDLNTCSGPCIKKDANFANKAWVYAPNSDSNGFGGSWLPLGDGGAVHIVVIAQPTIESEDGLELNKAYITGFKANP